jgi:3-oxoacyl-[acyl-carrier protein] reductase
MADKGITVNSIAPGAVETPGTAESISEEEYQQMKQAIPIGRWGKPSDIGDLVAFIASDKSDFITGRNIVADGGDVLH